MHSISVLANGYVIPGGLHLTGILIERELLWAVIRIVSLDVLGMILPYTTQWDSIREHGTKDLWQCGPSDGAI